MDPNLFAQDFELAFEVVITIALLAIFVERALAPLLESRWFIQKFEGKSVKELLAYFAGILVAWAFQFDGFAIVMSSPRNTIIGYILTGGVIAGGSKGSLKLIRDVLKIKSRAQQEKDESSDGNDDAAEQQGDGNQQQPSPEGKDQKNGKKKG